MAGGARSDLFGLGSRAACVLFWRGDEKILGAGGFADSDGTSCRISNELFGIAGEFFPAGADGERQRGEGDRPRRVAGRAGGGGENLSASDDYLRGLAAGIRGILSGLPGKNGKRGTSRCPNAASLRLVARERAPRNGKQSLPGHGTCRGIPHLGREPASWICLVFWTRFILDFLRAQCCRGFFQRAHGAGVCEQIPAGRRQDPARNFAGRELRGLVQRLSLSVRLRRCNPALHHRNE